MANEAAVQESVRGLTVEPDVVVLVAAPLYRWRTDGRKEETLSALYPVRSICICFRP